MKSAEIRKTFLEYFKERGHEVVKSSSLIPRRDPTLLFTNAGMVQFKSVFLGEETRPYKRAVTCQKSLRAGGKHSDIENVGRTARHHTFFEMLGNFSFGDYFKREAIKFAWELLTGVFGLQPGKLWVSVYEEDDEAALLWHEQVGVPQDKIIRLGAKDNFWQMADTGPCGPCSEIVIDQGPGMGCGKPDCKVGCDCDRYLELWNLVFMQFNRDERGTLNPLPNPSIDTGMGLERISAVLQGKKSNFDTDLFSDIKSSISALTGVPPGKGLATDVSINVIADHIRAAAFLITDSLIPSNEGRGYVLRRIIRRAARHARLLGAGEPLLYKVLDSVASTMGDAYPELIGEKERAAKILKVEEERFSRTLELGMRMLDEMLDALKREGRKVLPGKEVFRLYDTYGFPIDLARDIAAEGGYAIDEAGFSASMNAQRERARASWVGEEEAVASIYRELHSEIGKTDFTGYEETESESVVRAILMGGKIVSEAAEGVEAEVFLDRTPFYGESGGQVGDTGVMFAEGLMLDVLDVRRPVEGVFAHVVKVKKGPLRVWMKVGCRVDFERRRDIMRNHTATHLLQAGLRAVLGEHVKQAGSLVAPERLRFDFTHFSALRSEELEAVEEFVNEKVLEDLTVDFREMEIEEAISSGATALFGEKYGERVRVVSIASTSRELCGGTHVSATGKIGPFRITSEGSVASGIRRIEALAGNAALAGIREERREIKAIAELLKTDRPVERLRAVIDEIKELNKEKQRRKSAAARNVSLELAEGAKAFDGLKVVSARVDGLEPRDLRTLGDSVCERLGSGVVVLASVKDGRAALIAMVTKDLTGRFNAGEILRAVARASSGSGGGKAHMAQGGTKEIAKLDTALDVVYDIVRKG